jgi:general secretion pathway protein L
LEERISELQPAAVAADETRSAIIEADRQGSFFADKRNSTPTKIQLLDEISRIVPDDTWLTRIQVNGATVRIQGESEGASSLIGLIEESELLQNASFSSPVTKNPRTTNDRFVIEAQIEMGGDGT